MRIAYLDCASGISGDMTLGALVDAGVDLDLIAQGIDSLNLPSCKLVAEKVIKNGFRATQIRVEHEPEHAHRHLSQIVKLIQASKLSTAQQALAIRIFTRIGKAEAKVHGMTLEQVHFHEVGAVDSIADIVGASIGWDLLNVDRIVASHVPTGTGTVNIAHGRCSIPAPATAELLRGVPLAESHVPFELTTPTGAAILTEIVDSFGPIPSMTIHDIGYGAGERDLADQPNLLRLLIGEDHLSADEEVVWVLETNLDDVSGEVVGYCSQQLMESGALDVSTSAIQMKKNRPGMLLSVIAKPSDVSKLEAIIFQETSSLGVRKWPVQRKRLQRKAIHVHTELGNIQGKVGTLPDGTTKFSPEYESCQQIAKDKQLPLIQVYEVAQRAFEASNTIATSDHDHGSHDHSHDHDHSSQHDHDHSHDHDHGSHDHDH